MSERPHGAAQAPWPIPSGWKWMTVQDVGSVALGRQRSPANHNGPQMRPYVRAANITWNGWDLSDVKEMNFDDADFARFRLQPGDVLVNEGSGSANEVGKPAIWREHIKDCCFQNTLIRVQPKGCSSEYLYAYFLYCALSGRFVSKTQGVNIHHIGKEGLARFSLPVPREGEQRRIVAKIDSLSAKSKRARDCLDHIPRLVEKYKQAILTAAFRGELTREWREQRRGSGWPEEARIQLLARRDEYLRDRRGSRLRSTDPSVACGPPPAGWLLAQLSDVGSLQVGYAYKSKWYAKEGVRLLRGANIAPGRLTWDEVVCLPPDRAITFSQYKLNAGDIVIAMDRPIISTGLKVALVQPCDAGCLLVQRVARYVPSSFADSRFIWNVINSEHFVSHAVTQATGSDLPHISSNDILTTPLLLPPPAEQREIARRIETAFTWIDRLAVEATSARKLIDQLDQAVLAKAFRGELVPQDPTNEPAGALLERMRAERSTKATQKEK